MHADDKLLVGSGSVDNYHGYSLETKWSDPEWSLPDVDQHEYLDDVLNSQPYGDDLSAMVCCGRDLPLRPSHLTIVPQWTSGG